MLDGVSQITYRYEIPDQSHLIFGFVVTNFTQGLNLSNYGKQYNWFYGGLSKIEMPHSG